MIVADFLEPQEKAGIVVDGPPSGGWRFEQFKGDSSTERLVTTEIADGCFACHSQRKEQDFVFSVLRK